MSTKKTLLDVFCGCGGLSYGFEQADFQIIAGIDNWKDALLTFEKNHYNSKTFQVDLGNVKESDFQKITEKIDVVAGGPPCQGFSISGKRNPDDPRNKLYEGFVKTVKYFKPRAFVMENVPNLVSMSGGVIKDQIISDFETLGYEVKYKVLLASDYGVPQNRRRVIFVGILGQNDFFFPEATHSDNPDFFLNSKITCLDAMSDLPEENVADGTYNENSPQSGYQKLMRERTDKLFNHQITQHSEKTTKIISLVPDGGNYKSLPENLRSTRKVNIAWTRYNSQKPSLTIDTGHRHHFHYKYNRIPTVRESARLQSFPDDFIFYGTKTSQYKQVGNAVPPLMAKAIAEELMKTLSERSESANV